MLVVCLYVVLAVSMVSGPTESLCLSSSICFSGLHGLQLTSN